LENTVRFSIVVATYNSADTLHRCIDSIENQDHPNKDLIIVDGASSDGTVDILRARGEVIHHWQSEQDTGVYQAWNRALDHVNGDWIHFMGSDDYFLSPDVLSKIAARVRCCSENTLLVYGQSVLTSPSGSVQRVRGRPWQEARKMIDQGGGMPLPHPAVFYRRTVFQKVGRFNENFRISGDFEFVLRILKLSTPVFLDGIMVSAMTLGGVSNRPENQMDRIFERGWARSLHGLPRHPPGYWREHPKDFIYCLLCETMGRRGAHGIRKVYRSLTRLPWVNESGS